MDLIVEIPLTLRNIIVAAIGLVFGSFVTALSYRLPRGESIAKGRSRCPSCAHTLTARDLAPVFSWLLHKGRCGHCGVNISWRYPAIEIITAVLFVLVVASSNTAGQMGLLLVITPVIVSLAVIDIEHEWLPNGLVAILALLVVALRWVSDGEVFVGLALAAGVVIAGLLINTGCKAYKGSGGLGLSNVKLMAVGAFALPLYSFLFFLTLTALLSVFCLAIWKWTRPNRTFSLCPAILASFWVCLAAEGLI